MGFRKNCTSELVERRAMCWARCLASRSHDLDRSLLEFQVTRVRGWLNSQVPSRVLENPRIL